MTIEITSPLDYGAGHDTGTGKQPDGAPVWKRPFMFVVLGEDTDKLDTAFEEAFGG